MSNCISSPQYEAFIEKCDRDLLCNAAAGCRAILVYHKAGMYSDTLQQSQLLPIQHVQPSNLHAQYVDLQGVCKPVINCAM